MYSCLASSVHRCSTRNTSLRSPGCRRKRCLKLVRPMFGPVVAVDCALLDKRHTAPTQILRGVFHLSSPVGAPRADMAAPCGPSAVARSSFTLRRRIGNVQGSPEVVLGKGRRGLSFACPSRLLICQRWCEFLVMLSMASFGNNITTFGPSQTNHKAKYVICRIAS